MTTPLQSSLEDGRAGSSASLKEVFTPGPWNPMNDWGEITGPRGYHTVCKVYYAGTTMRTHGEYEANGRLIAAAPDLLKALDDLLELAVWMTGSADFGPGGIAHEGWKRLSGVRRLTAAQDAISKATSSSSERSEAAPTQDTEGGK